MTANPLAYELADAALAAPTPEPLRVSWPVLGEPAYHGLAGEVVAAIEPHSESDPAALFLTFFAAFGALVGPGPHAFADGAEHPARVWPLVVGDTAKARKGSSWQQVRRVMAAADDYFVRERVVGGFGSGEALVDAVASSDDAPADPRLLLLETEFSRILAVGKREGSTLSSLLRQAWDGGRLQVRSRTGTAVADGAHVVVVGHITRHELLARLAESDAHGGTLNRFLVVGARRSKLLPAGGNLDDRTIEYLGQKVARVAAEARKVGLIRRTPEAEQEWEVIYTRLAQDEPGGLLGAVIARDAAQVLRLSVIYALLDGANQVDVAHLRAADAVWCYSRASAALVFGEMVGDPVADLILNELRRAGPAGLTGTQLHELLGRHAKADRIEQATKVLVDRGLANKAKEATKGRPLAVLRLANKANQAKKDDAEGLSSLSSLSSHYTADEAPWPDDDFIDGLDASAEVAS